MAVVGVAILAAPGVGADPVDGGQRCRDVVLGRERVAGRERDFGAAGLEGPHQVGGLGGDVEAGRDPDPLEGLLALEPLADQAEDGHLALGPFDAPNALGGEAEVGDVVGGQRGFGHRGWLLGGATRRPCVPRLCGRSPG